MPKNSPPKGGTSKVRFIMLEAEMPEGDLTQITLAIQNALKSSGTTSVRTHATPVALRQVDEVADDAQYADLAVEDHAAEELPTRKTAAATPRARKPKSRKVVEIDLDSHVSFADFVEQHTPKSDMDRHLVAVAFFQEHRKEVEGVTADLVYTCFRKQDWPAGSRDFSQPLRHLKSKQLLVSGPARGTYAVNHIGMDHLRKMRGG